MNGNNGGSGFYARGRDGYVSMYSYDEATGTFRGSIDFGAYNNAGGGNVVTDISRQMQILLDSVGQGSTIIYEQMLDPFSKDEVTTAIFQIIHSSLQMREDMLIYRHN